MATLTVEVPDQELWSSVFGSAFETWDWWRAATFHGAADWNKIGTVTLMIDDPNFDEDGGQVITKTLDLDDVVAAVNAVTKLGLLPYPSLEDLDWDACDADVILQYAVLGDVVYG